MRAQKPWKELDGNERGSTLYIVAASLIVILGLAGLAIDLVALYADRSEMQRAADAGALAGAQQFVTSSFITGGTSQSQVTVFRTTPASQRPKRIPSEGRSW